MANMINSTFLSAPYPGVQGYGGHPTGLLYALSELAKRKLNEYGSKDKVSEEIAVFAPEGVKFFEGSSLESKLSNHFKTHNSQILGISTFSSSYQNALKVMKLAKKQNPEIISIFGGVHEDNYVNQYKKQDKIDADIVVAGNASYVLDKLYRVIEENKLTSKSIIPYLEENKTVIENTDGAAVILYNSAKGLKEIKTKGNFQALDKLAIMPRYLERDEIKCAESFFIFQNEDKTPKKTTQIMIEEGCPMNCSFCSEGIKKVWYDVDAPKSKLVRRNITHVISEFDNIKKRGYEAIFFDDSTFFAKPNHELIQLFNTLENYDFEWACQTTAKSLYQKLSLLEKAKNSGLSYIYFGIEHVNKEILDSFGGTKKVNVDLKTIFSEMLKQKVRAGISLTFGHPNQNDSKHKTLETKETAKEAIDYVGNLLKMYENIISNVAINLITYHPGTPLSQNAEDKGINLDYIGLPNSEKPFTFFEEGMGQHAKGLNKELVNYIRSYAKKIIGSKLLLNKD